MASQRPTKTLCLCPLRGRGVCRLRALGHRLAPTPTSKTITCQTTACWWTLSPHRDHARTAKKTAGGQPHALVLAIVATPHTRIHRRTRTAMAPDKTVQRHPWHHHFDAEQSRSGYWFNQFCASLELENCARFSKRARHLTSGPLSEEHRAGYVLAGIQRMRTVATSIFWHASELPTA